MDDSDNHLHIKDTCNLQNSTWVLESAMSRFSTQKLGSQKTWFISVSSRIIPLYAFGMTEVLATHHDNYFLYNPGNKNSHFPYKSKVPELEEMKSKFTPFNWGQKWGAIGMVGQDRGRPVQLAAEEQGCLSGTQNSFGSATSAQWWLQFCGRNATFPTFLSQLSIFYRKLVSCFKVF